MHLSKTTLDCVLGGEDAREEEGRTDEAFHETLLYYISDYSLMLKYAL